MKKFISIVMILVLSLSCCFCTMASAKNGDVIGKALHSDIVAYINHYAIPSYIVNDRVVVIAEDLKNFGFNVMWDSNTRTLNIYRNTSKSVYKMNFNKEGKPGTVYKDVLETDIKVYADRALITSYNIDGKTMIPLEELTMFGSFAWVPEIRALKMWIEDGLQINSSMQNIHQFGYTNTQTVNASSNYYPNSTIPTYTSVTGVQQNRGPSFETNGAIYSYKYTTDNDIEKYFNALSANGWYYYENKTDYENYSVTAYFTKGTTMMGVTTSVKHNEVWITYLY